MWMNDSGREENGEMSNDGGGGSGCCWSAWNCKCIAASQFICLISWAGARLCGAEWLMHFIEYKINSPHVLHNSVSTYGHCHGYYLLLNSMQINLFHFGIGIVCEWFSIYTTATRYTNFWLAHSHHSVPFHFSFFRLDFVCVFLCWEAI